MVTRETRRLERSLRTLICLTFSTAQGILGAGGDECVARRLWQTAREALAELEDGRLNAASNALRRLERLADGHAVRPRVSEIRLRLESIARHHRTSGLGPLATALSLE